MIKRKRAKNKGKSNKAKNSDKSEEQENRNEDELTNDYVFRIIFNSLKPDTICKYNANDNALLEIKCSKLTGKETNLSQSIHSRRDVQSEEYERGSTDGE